MPDHVEQSLSLTHATGGHVRARAWTWGTTFLVAAALYASTMIPGLSWGDSGNAQLRTLVGHFYDRIDLSRSHTLYYVIATTVARCGVEPAVAANLVSAVAGAVTVANCALFLSYCLNRTMAVLSASMLLMFCHSLWHLSTIAEVMTLSTVVLSTELILVYRYLATDRREWLLAALFVNGLGFAVHNMAILLWPAYCVLLFRRRAGRARPSAAVVLECMAAVAAGAVPWMALIAIGFSRYGSAIVAINEVLAGRYSAHVYNLNLSVTTLVRLLLYTAYVFPTPIVLLFVWGIITCYKRCTRALFFFLMTALGVFTLFAVRYNVPDQHTFMIHSYLLAAVSIGFGIDYALTRWQSRAIAVAVVACCATAPLVYSVLPDLLRERAPNVAPLPARQLVYRDRFDWFLKPWHNEDRGAEDFARATLAALPIGAVLVIDSTLMPPILYLQNKEGLRQDVQIPEADPYQSWFEHGFEMASDDLDRAINEGLMFTVTHRKSEVNAYLQRDDYSFVPLGCVFRVIRVGTMPGH